jgi:uncharacterized RDD family membrane protein YckC
MSTLSNEINPYAPPSADSDVAGEAVDGTELFRATRGQRFVAALLDGILYIPFIGVAMFFLFNDLQSGTEKEMAALKMQAFVLPLAALQWYLIVRTGQTLGKRWTRLKILRTDGRPVDFVSGVLLRNWVLYLVPMILSILVSGSEQVTSLVSLVDVLMIFGAAHRCLHDYIAGTMVVQLPGSSV